MKILDYDVLNSNGSATQQPVLRVKLHGVILAEVRPGHSNPLKYVRTRPLDPARKEFVQQLQANGVSDDDIRTILSLPCNKQK